MKRIISIIVFSIITISFLSGQTRLDKINAPSSPGASVIGIQPTTILTPKTYEALEANLFSNYLSDEGGLVIPNDVGLEFTPYWMGNHELSDSSYLFPNVGEAFLRNLSVSVASTQNYLLGDSVNSNAIGIGLRTSFYFPGKKNREAGVALLNSLINTNEVESEIRLTTKILIKNNLKRWHTKVWFLDTLVSIIKDVNQNEQKLFATKEICDRTLANLYDLLIEKLPEYSEETKEVYWRLIEKQLEDFFKRYEKLEKVEKFRDLKQGWTIDLAWAMAMDFPSNNLNYSFVPKNSLWVTASYLFRNNSPAVFKLLFVVNYNWYNDQFFEKYFPENDFYEYNLDGGMGLNFSYKKFSAQIEAIARSSKEIIEKSEDEDGIVTTKSRKNNDFQCIGNLSYQISDALIITYNIGKRFEPVFSFNGTLVNTLSLNFGFGGPTDKDLKE